MKSQNADVSLKKKMRMSKFVSVGKILNFHGIQGEAKVGFSKNQQNFLLSLSEVFVKSNGDYLPLKISRSRVNKNVVIIKFDGINSINELLPYKGQLLFVEEATIRSNLAEDEFLIDELVGLKIFDIKTDKSLGVVIGVSNNGATDLLSVKVNDGNVHFVPFVKDIVPVVNIKDKRIMINNLEGLLS